MLSGVVPRISIHASREGSDIREAKLRKAADISIHASREGSDSWKFQLFFCHHNFNPRFPRGKRHNGKFRFIVSKGFQSTLPAREATELIRKRSALERFQSTLPAREATLLRPSCYRRQYDFNPRFPRGKRPF